MPVLSPIRPTCFSTRGTPVMIDRWLDLPLWGIFVSLIVAFFFSAWAIHWLCFKARSRTLAATLVGVVPPFFGSVAVLFALLTGFLANEVWDRNRQAARTVLAERETLQAIQAISIATVTNMEDIRAATRLYTELLLEDEWPLMREQGSSAKAGRALLALLGQISNPEVARSAGPAAQTALLDAVLKLRSARDDRLALSSDQTDRTKWIAVLFLALITQVAIGIVHLDKPRAQLAALTIFSSAVVVTLGLIAIRERPFDGTLHVSPAPIAEALRSMSNAPTP